MSDGRTRLARVAVVAGGITLLGVAVYAASRDEAPEPGGLTPVIARDGGSSRALPDGGTRTIARLDGAVQIHLPVEGTPIDEVLGPEELRARRRSQVALIEERLAALEEDLAQVPEDTVIRARIEQLRERRDTLRRLLEEEDEPEAPVAPEGF